MNFVKLCIQINYTINYKKFNLISNSKFKNKKSKYIIMVDKKDKPKKKIIFKFQYLIVIALLGLIIGAYIYLDTINQQNNALSQSIEDVSFYNIIIFKIDEDLNYTEDLEIGFLNLGYLDLVNNNEIFVELAGISNLAGNSIDPETAKGFNQTFYLSKTFDEEISNFIFVVNVTSPYLHPIIYGSDTIEYTGSMIITITNLSFTEVNFTVQEIDFDIYSKLV